MNIIMFKTKNNFFSDQKNNVVKARKTVKQQLRTTTYSRSESKPKIKQHMNTTESLGMQQMTKSQVLLPKRSAMFFTSNKTSFGSFRFQKTHSQNRSQIKSVHLKRKASTSYNKFRSKQQKHRSVQPSRQSMSALDNQLVQKLTQIQQQYLQHYGNQMYNKAAESLTKILNYSIDYNLPKLLLRCIKQLSQFYLTVNKQNQAIFYLNQAISCAFLLNEPDMIIDSIIGCTYCCRKYQMFEESIILLKKGLECAWFFNKPEHQMKIYDELGKIYYLMGELQRAMQFHDKFIDALLQPEDSPQRMLSKQRMIKWFSQSQMKIYNQICPLLLSNLTLPIMKFDQLPPLSQKVQTLRNQLDISTKYIGNFTDFKYMISKILRQQFFGHEMEDPQTIAQQQKTQLKTRKYDFIQFKMKQHLKQLGIGADSKIQLKPKNLQYKESLDEKVRKKLKQPGLDPEWEQKMVRQIKRDRKNKLFKVHSQIRVRGKNKKIKPEIDQIHKIFLPLYR